MFWRHPEHRPDGIGTEEYIMALTPYQQTTLRRAEMILAGLVRESDVLSSPDEVRSLIKCRIGASEHEVFVAIWLDNRHRVIEIVDMFHGTIDSAAVYPREVVKAALKFNAAAVVFAHNHPSFTAEPSDTDVRLTRKLVDGLALIDVRVLDHLVVGGPNITSLAERGLM